MRTLILLILVCALGMGRAMACTTAVISGRCTPDGRPLLLKHRDTDELRNRIQYFGDGKHACLGLMDARDTIGREIWAGINSAGFAIMNSADYNLNLGDTTGASDQEGVLMKMALQTCATVQEFESFLRSLPRPLGVSANFGVIDAEGGAAYFETGNDTIVKFDATDPAIAPSGYLIRTNFALSGVRSEDRGTIRFTTAHQLLSLADSQGTLTSRFLLRHVSRSLRHSLTGVDLAENLPADDVPHFVPFRDFIPRHSSSASVVVQGVKPGESPGEATLWTVLGFPLSAVAVPVWVGGGPALPPLLAGDSSGTGPLCVLALQLKERMFPEAPDACRDYLNLSAVMNRKGTGILQKILPLEESVLDEAEKRLASWRGRPFQAEELQQFYRWADTTIVNSYRRLFGQGQ